MRAGGGGVNIHPELQQSLDAAPLGQLTFVVTQAGEPFTSKGFGNWISAAAKAAGLPAGAAVHGLRRPLHGDWRRRGPLLTRSWPLPAIGPSKRSSDTRGRPR